jgi:hypothetical protein
MNFNLGTASTGAVITWAESLGEALGRGIGRGISNGLGSVGSVVSTSGQVVRRGPGRPPKALTGVATSGRLCKAAGCGRAARSKGLCSAHYQADRRRRMAKA